MDSRIDLGGRVDVAAAVGIDRIDCAVVVVDLDMAGEMQDAIYRLRERRAARREGRLPRDR